MLIATGKGESWVIKVKVNKYMAMEDLTLVGAIICNIKVMYHRMVH